MIMAAELRLHLDASICLHSDDNVGRGPAVGLHNNAPKDQLAISCSTYQDHTQKAWCSFNE